MKHEFNEKLLEISENGSVIALCVCPVLLYVVYEIGKIGKYCNRENANKDLYILFE